MNVFNEARCLRFQLTYVVCVPRPSSRATAQPPTCGILYGALVQSRGGVRTHRMGTYGCISRTLRTAAPDAGRRRARRRHGTLLGLRVAEISLSKSDRSAEDAEMGRRTHVCMDMPLIS
ncbi:hypothetical protein EVAR_46303_1 [Eumeta japonica]|uniref:Uncharacterized protein n=1 Tax=Eumeta variegata TaxID=151549 RepID=A0A4C1XY53_EUMVA|nr:hypothetical protein EVAR_46303_1 [Eumeta japonica]